METLTAHVETVFADQPVPIADKGMMNTITEASKGYLSANRGERFTPLWTRTEKNRTNNYPIIHCPTSEGVSEVSERASAAEGASEASSPEQANE